jgi:hypothetical protein
MFGNSVLPTCLYQPFAGHFHHRMNAIRSQRTAAVALVSDEPMVRHYV